MAAIQQFALLVAELPTKDQMRGLFERCADLTVEQDPRRGTTVVSFDRYAPSLVDAIVSAVRDVESVGLVPVRVRDDEDLVTLGEIADRVGRSREAVRLWSLGRTGPGGFPPPVYGGLSTAFYRWSQVAPWIRDRMGLAVTDPEPILAAVNLALQLRVLAPRVSRMDAVRALLAA